MLKGTNCTNSCTGSRPRRDSSAFAARDSATSGDERAYGQLTSQVMMMRHVLQEMDGRLKRMEGESSSARNRDVQHQMAIAAMTEEIMSARVGNERSAGKGKDDGFSLSDLDTLISARLQPFDTTLKTIEKETTRLSRSMKESTPLKGNEPSDFEAKNSEMDNAISKFILCSKEARRNRRPDSSRASSQASSASGHRDSVGVAELERFRESLLADLQLHQAALFFGLRSEFDELQIAEEKTEVKKTHDSQVMLSIPSTPPLQMKARVDQDYADSALRPLAIQPSANMDYGNYGTDTRLPTAQSLAAIPSPNFSPRGLTSDATPTGDAPKKIKSTADFMKKVQHMKKSESDRLANFQREGDGLYDIELKEETGLSSVFANDTDPERDPYHVEDYYKTTGWSQSVVRDRNFATLTMVMVILNAVWIGIEADRMQSDNLYDANWVFIVAAQIFTVFFTFEWLVRILAFENKWDGFRDGWIKFDTFLVVTMILDVWVLMVLMKIFDAGARNLPTQPLRVLRLFKLTRMAKLMKCVPELVIMIKGLGRSMRAILSTFILVVLMTYVWAILIHMLLKKEDEFNEAIFKQSFLDFTTLPRAMWCLLMDGTLLLDNSAPLMTEMLFHDKINIFFAGLAFTFFSFISALLILQMLIGVLCDVVSQVNQEQRSGVAIALVRQELSARLKQVTVDGKITKENLHEVMVDARSVAVLDKLKINRLFLMQMQEMVFDLSPEITIKGALDLMLLCRSDNLANVEVLAGGFCFIAKELSIMRKRLKENFEKISGNLHESLIATCSSRDFLGMSVGA